MENRLPSLQRWAQLAFGFPIERDGDGDEPDPPGHMWIWDGEGHHELWIIQVSHWETVEEKWITPHHFHSTGFRRQRISFRYARVALASAVLPLVWVALLVRRVRRGWQREGHCVACGYDLRASKDRCPECGTPIPAGQASLKCGHS